MPGRMVFWVETRPERGFGHAMRCLALAQEGARWRRGARFVAPAWPQVLERRLRNEGFEVVQGGLDAVAAELEPAGDATPWLIVDGSEAEAVAARGRRSGARVLLLDDGCRRLAAAADLVVDPNPPAGGAADVDTGPGASGHVLVGPRYAMLRRDVLEPAPPPRSPARLRRVLVTLGGAPPLENVRRLLAGIQAADLEGLEVRAALGSHRAAALRTPTCFQDVVPVDAGALGAAEMDAADVALCGAGTTAWELAYRGVPMLVAPQARDQVDNATYLEEMGCAINLGWGVEVLPEAVARHLRHWDAAPELRRAMSERQRALVDGRGCARLVAALEALDLQLRPVTVADRERLWEWANDPGTRAASFSTDPIPWDRHQEWFARVAAPDAAPFWIARTTGRGDVGSVRLSRTATGTEVHLTVAPEHRGLGFGLAILRAALAAIRDRETWRPVRAWIKPDNEASRHVFAAAGFRRAPHSGSPEHPGAELWLHDLEVRR